jgi:glycosyltransferase involved in cell wall biosynthesis
VRILCIYPWLELGGADKFNLDMLAQLGRRGWQIRIATTLPSNHAWRSAFEPLSEQIIDLSDYPPDHWPAQLLVAAQDCDVIFVSHSQAAYLFLPFLRAHLPQTAFVDYCHILEPSWLRGGYPRISLQHGAYLDMQIVASQQLQSWMRQQKSAAQAIEVCTINVDPDLWNLANYDQLAVRAAYGIEETAPVVAYIGRLTQQKQPQLALEVMRSVLLERPDLVFMVAGDGEYRAWVEAFIEHYGLKPQIRMLGALANEQVRELLAITTVLFLPSENEGISLAIYEAMAMGVVPLSADVGGQRELVTPETGVLVQRGPQEQDAYQKALVQLLADPQHLAAMGAAARQRVIDHFSLQAMGERIDHLLRQALARRRASTDAISTGEALAAAKRAVAFVQAEQAARDRSWSSRLQPARLLRALMRRLRGEV